MVGATIAARRSGAAHLGIVKSRRTRSRSLCLQRITKTAEQFLGNLPGRTDSFGWILGDAESEHSRLYTICALSKVSNAGAGPGPAADDDRLRIYRSCRDQRYVADLRQGYTGSGRVDAPVR